MKNRKTKKFNQQVFYYFESDLLNPNFVDAIIDKALRGEKVKMVGNN